MKIVKNILRYIIVIMIIISVISLALVKIVSSTILNEAYVLKILDTSGYYDNIYKDLESNFENYIHQSGLDESVIKDICTKEDIKNSTEIILANIYEGTNKAINTDKIKQKLNDNISKSLEGIQVTSKMQQSIDTFVDTICNEYTSTMSQTKYEKVINDNYKKIEKLTSVAQTALCITTLLGVVLIVSLSYKRIYRCISLIGISLVSSGAFLVIVDLIVNFKVKIQYIKILNDSISVVLQNIIADILNKIVQTGSVLLAIGVGFIIVSSIVKIQKLKKKGVNNGRDKFKRII